LNLIKGVIMEVFATSKNKGPTWSGLDPTTLVYLGTSFDEAELAVGGFSKYERDGAEWPWVESEKIYAGLPREIDWEMVKWYMADGWWYSIVMFELKEPA
jgi:hypothetical protein